MVFSSIFFLFYFLPVFLGLYFLLPKLRNPLLLGFSVLFYTWGEPVYILLLFFSVAANYGFGRLIGEQTSRKKKWLALGLGVNLSVLVLFKYAGFVCENLGSLFSVEGAAGFKGFALPLGISFYTFQAISYLMDVYRGEAPVEKSPLALANYIFMFPQLVAGPIVRYRSIHQKLRSREHTMDQFLSGMHIFVLGLAAKVLIANTVAVPADQIFAESTRALSMPLAWLGAWFYSIQIYFDFMGYSLMAIGLGRIMGFEFPENFNSPYISTSVTEFWRRWHISLSTWFRDYLYIPLGGSRRGSARTYTNLVVVFVLCGIWHGASWSFLVWGIYHGVFLVLERIRLNRFGRVNSGRWLGHFYLIGVCMVGWVLFRCETLTQSVHYIQAMLSLGPVDKLPQYTLAYYSQLYLIMITLVATILCFSDLKAAGQWIRSSVQSSSFSPEFYTLGKALCSLLLLVYAGSILGAGTHNPFIYFRF